jgi:hypothetical protein
VTVVRQALERAQERAQRCTRCPHPRGQHETHAVEPLVPSPGYDPNPLVCHCTVVDCPCTQFTP